MGTDRGQFERLIADIANAIEDVDRTGIPHKAFQPGVGPYGEVDLVRLIRDRLARDSRYDGAITKRAPDLLVPGKWAIEFKLARPFGDNGRPAEDWSVNLLHPYEGNTSLIGDCMKLSNHTGPETPVAVAIGYEHTPAQVKLEPLFAAFELLARSLFKLKLGQRAETRRAGLRHPVHQQVVVVGWEVAS